MQKNNTKNKQIVKVVFVGNIAVGKTSCIQRLTQNQFSFRQNVTISPDHVKYTLKYKNFSLDLRLWDTAGQEQYKSAQEFYFKGSHGAIIVCSVLEENPEKQITYWLQRLNNKCPEAQKIIIFNKIDNESDRIVTPQQIQEIQQKFNIKCFEISVFLGQQGIKDALLYLSEMIVQNMDSPNFSYNESYYLKHPNYTTSILGTSIQQQNTNKCC